LKFSASLQTLGRLLQGPESVKSLVCGEYMDAAVGVNARGIARVRLMDGSIHLAEVHWYEAAGIGRKEFKIKHLIES
jgi:hypothetical protein